jgi:uncharacterized membrane protein YbhN (UPF0104 family)
MQVLGWVRQQLTVAAALVIGGLVAVTVAAVLVRAVDRAALAAAAAEAADHPLEVVVALAAFGLAFVVRALAWQRTLPGLGFGQALSGIHLALGANHVLPFRLGEPLRAVSAVRRAGVAVDAAAASTITLRAADVLSVVGLGVVVSPALFSELLGAAGWFVVAVVGVVAGAAWHWLSRIDRGRRYSAGERAAVRRPGPVALGLSTAAWLAEAVVVWQAARWAGLEPTWTEAILVTTVAVAAQIAAVAPGGLGTYEAAAVAAFVALGHDPRAALVAALSAHAVKTGYSLVAGAAAVAWPRPSILGRLRVPATGVAPPPVDIEPGAPVVLFMPAHDEEATVATCVSRAPASVGGHPVQVLVIDDGSSDQTAARARAAGAEVISLGVNRGLGAAVRVGLAEAVDRGAAATAFCDADDEYPTSQLAELVTPILDGHADYVVGSRFLGQVEHMRPHRRLGNLVLTRLLAIVARRPISDGQSGYRAFSLSAAARAEIIHDFNYAQVLTLDLLAKGYRYLEVPISYRFRTTGRSFVKLGPYLRHVVPAVYRELNAS